jgi:hypothetical protein
MGVQSIIEGVGTRATRDAPPAAQGNDAGWADGLSAASLEGPQTGSAA